MSPLRQRMIEDMTLAGLAAGTQQHYVQAVRRLAAHYRRPPDQLSEEEVRAYLLDLCQRGVARGTFQSNQYGLRFLYHHTLNRMWGLFGEKRIAAPRQKRLPETLSDDQVRQLLSGIYSPVHRTCLALMYACGLRIGEATKLEISAIDRANRRSVFALHRACLHQYHQPETENCGREFSCEPIENGHDSRSGHPLIGWAAVTAVARRWSGNRRAYG
jgi:site-specific recombinase XerD